MITGLEIPFDRIMYRDGQRLSALDLNDDCRSAARKRHIHAQYLHGTWGIALGFEVTQTATDSLSVAPGYAIDEAGRDLLLAHAVHIPVPALEKPVTLVLTMNCWEDGAYRNDRDRSALCSTGCYPRYAQPQFCWCLPEAVRFGPQVPLVQINIANGAIAGALDLRMRPQARPQTRPHIGWGATEPGASGWDWWVSGQKVGLMVKIDTSAAGFTKPPHYFASLQGNIASNVREIPLGVFTSVTRISPDGFIYQIAGVPEFQFADIEPEDAEQRRWTVSWFGIEPTARKRHGL